MQHVASPHPIGTVVLAAASLARYAEFWMSVEGLKVPVGTRLAAGNGADIPHQFNECLRSMLGEWVWFLGDDHTFSPDLLLSLLDRQVDVVVPLTSRRNFPYAPVILHGPLSPKMRRYQWAEVPRGGVYQLPKDDPAGQAGMLVRKPVLDRIGDPWFEGGKVVPGRLMEDMYFIQRLHDLDIPIYIDCDHPMGHLATFELWPSRHNGRWYCGYKTKHGTVCMDEVVPEEAACETP